jgi:DNA-binding transcriptional MerR regulator
VDEKRYGIEELADLGGVSRRTVRYYVQEGLLPAPLGVGRGDHYGRKHLERLLHVKALQQAGLTLDEVRRELARGCAGRRARGLEGQATVAERSVPAASPERPSGKAAPPPHSAWTRVEVLPGIELHLSGRYRTPSRRALEELAGWCREHFAVDEAKDEE